MCNIIIVAEVPRTRSIGAVHAIITIKTPAEPKVAGTMVAAIVGAPVDIILPHVTQSSGVIGDVLSRWLGLGIPLPSIQHNELEVRAIDHPVLGSAGGMGPLQDIGKVSPAIVTVTTSIPSRGLPARLRDEDLIGGTTRLA